MSSLREATLADIGGIRAVAEAAWWPTYWEILPEAIIRQALAEQYAEDAFAAQLARGQRVFVTERDGAISGFLAAQPQPYGVEVARLYIHPAHQGGGQGRALMDQAAQAFPGERLELLVNRRNLPAIRFYLRWGMRILRAQNAELVAGFWKEDWRLGRTLA